MLGKRIIPTMLVRGSTLVKGREFAGDRSVGHVLQAAKVHAMRGVDELMILDIGATVEGRGPDLEMVKALSADCFIPITVGGGVRTLDDIKALLRAGADKVCIGSAGWESESLIRGAADRFGRQAIVVSLDCKPMVWTCCTRGHMTATCRNGAIGLLDLDAHGNQQLMTPRAGARRAEEHGAGEILLQAVSRDGTMEGYDLDLITEVSEATSIPVIAAGGCQGYADMLAAIEAGADAVAAGALFQFTDATPRGAAKYLKEHGKCVRL